MSAPTFLSLFAGAGGFDLGLEAAGWECVGQVEIDPQARAVLRHRWPHVPKLEDVRHVGAAQFVRGSIDLICGGFPCQDLSVAGRRKGLAGARSGLFYECMRIVDELAPRWVLLENVPGLLSSNGGRDMGAVLGTLGELGYGYAYRVLDLQHFGVPQRRRRVFIVACAGGVCPPEVLFEPESVYGDPAPRGEAGEGSPRGAAEGAAAARWWNGDDLTPALTCTLHNQLGRAGHGGADNIGAVLTPITMATGQANAEVVRDGEPSLTTLHEAPIVAGAWKPSHYTRGKDGALSPVVPPLSADADKGDQDPLVRAPAGEVGTVYTIQSPERCNGQGGAGIGENVMYTLATHNDPHAVVQPIPFDTTQITSAANYSRPRAGDPCHPLAAGAHAPAIAFHQTHGPEPLVMDARQMNGFRSTHTNSLQSKNSGGWSLNYIPTLQTTPTAIPRRLTPKECERLMSWPDDHTRSGVTDEGKRVEMADGPRYRMAGNGVGSVVAEWIGRRMLAVHLATRTEEAA